MRIELITFDLDNTLWESHSVLRRATQKTNAWIRERVPNYSDLGAEQLQALHIAVQRERTDISHDVSAFRIAFMERCFLAVGMAKENARRLSQEAFHVFIYWRCQVEPYPDGEKLLAALSSRYKLASLTNGNADVTQTSISRYFTFCIDAASAGAAKPSKKIFQQALALGKVSDPSRAIHIGDSLQDDVIGASEAGMKSVWLNHAGELTETLATAVVHSLGDVEAAVGRIEAAG